MLSLFNKILNKESDLNVQKQPSFELGQLLRVSYKDQLGNITDRDVMVVSYKYMEKKPLGEYIDVFCYLKEESRIFYVSRILEHKCIKPGDLKK